MMARSLNEPLATARPRARSVTSLVVAPLLVAVLSLVTPRAPLAQSLIAQAQSLFDQGQELLSAGKFAEACAAFQASHKLDPAVTTLLNLADCRAQNGQLATAWGHFLEAERMANTSANKKLATIAARHAARLKPRLSKLIIVVPADHQVPGLLLLRGDEAIDSATWNHALPVDGGPYQLTAKAPGRQPWTTTIQIKPERDVQTIEIPSFSTESRPPQVAPRPATSPSAPAAATQAEPSPARPSSTTFAQPTVADPFEKSSSDNQPTKTHPSASSAPSASTPTVSTAEEPRPPSLLNANAPRRPSRLLPFILGTGALAFTTGAIVFKVSGDDFYDRAKAARTQEARDSAYDSANTRRHVSLGLGTAAIACASTAIYLLLWRTETRPNAATWMPVASPQQAGIALVGSW